jgi:hypothetical protein
MNDSMMCLSEIPYDIIMLELSEIKARLESEDTAQMEDNENE